ncbi:MAG: hypothetical protein U0525_01330 [Patescibacteria group bacterium]
MFSHLKILHKKLNERLMLAGMFAFVALGALYLYLTYTSKEVNPDSYINPTPTTILGMPSEEVVNGMKRFRSEQMGFELNYPDKFKIEQNGQFISLVDSNFKKINLSKSGSMFDDVNSHVNDSIKTWRKQPSIRRDFIGDGQNGLLIEKTISETPYRIIYYVKDYFVYQIETGDLSLFKDLETIAKSLKILE